ncbi:RNA methyltransferase, RsmE family [Desulfocapsa sulfexigens DSM 10523]|uniref:Ribosomal RNA small subunit methyltransferase E n=1 Tax=Desulfocapsa sulfexigens (strain DSM 10523 / SB164P1) TaxID=1167006 RepID=M1PU06_DESSD|nr:16S rRNA (uracil(1498)-N(3))-methyltransferase [Desulfocapsa sulfexigens]AGF79826.1 RNA methyltransferase, RsmE family [Desulfocapsa sulfexigens DSM 10523]
MNIILFEKEELTPDNHVIFNDHRAKHIVKILQSEVGDSVRVGEVNGAMGTGNVLTIHRKYPFIVELAVTLSDSPASQPAIDLLLALPRPIMLKRILTQVTALGVGTIYLINANRVEKSFWDAGILKEEEYRPHLIHGLEQAVDTRLPDVRMCRHFRPFVEDYLPKICGNYSSLVLAHPNSDKSLSHCLVEDYGKVLYAVGPEGGWVDFEVEKFLNRGLQSFSIGRRILKVDTAVVAIHGRISQLMESKMSF